MFACYLNSLMTLSAKFKNVFIMVISWWILPIESSTENLFWEPSIYNHHFLIWRFSILGELSTIIARGVEIAGPWNILENLGRLQNVLRFTGRVWTHFGIFYLKKISINIMARHAIGWHKRFSCIREGSNENFYVFDGGLWIVLPSPCHNCWQLPMLVLPRMV